MKIGSVCSGYEGLGAAVQAVIGGDLEWVADIDEGACKILAHRFPSVPNVGDITTAPWGAIKPVDVFCAGFPCQPVSLAGKRLGEADERWIWPSVAGAVRDLRPGLVFLENVSALVVRGLAGVAADLAAIGYVGSWCCVRASDVGAPHRRERVFILARPAEDTDRPTRGQRRQSAPGQAQIWRSRSNLGRPGGVRAIADTAGDARRIGHGDDVLPWGGTGRYEPDAGGSAPADAASNGRDARRPEPARLIRGLDAAIRSDVAADPDGHGFPWSAERHSEPERRQASHEQRRVDPLRCVLDWGIYTLAIRRWERVFGRPAPRPTEPGRTGERLSPQFVEWMMGLPEGWVTDVPGLSRNAQLKALGNGVVPAQAAMALRLLLERAGISPLAADRGAA